MGILSDLFGASARAAPSERVEPRVRPRNASPENPSTSLAAPDRWFTDWAGAGSSFGPAVNERTAMQVSAVFACVRIISDAVANLPLKVFRRTAEGREEAPGHRVARLLRLQPYPGRAMTSHTWRGLVQTNVLLWGDHFSAIRYDNAARVVGLEALPPWDVSVEQTRGVNTYVVRRGPGQVERLDQEDVLHVPGIGFDGVRGVSRISHFARNAISMAKLLEEQSARVHENAARPSGVVTAPKGISADGFKRMRAQFEADNTGRANAGRVAFLDEGSTYTPFQMTPEDLVTLEHRRFQVAEIARIYGVPLHLLHETDKSTSWGSGIAEQNLAFLIYTLDAELSRIEAEINLKLFPTDEYYAEFVRDALLAMNPIDAARVAQTEIGSGVLTINEYRRAKNRPPVPGGDAPLVNSTNVPLDRALNPPAPAGRPAAPVKDTPADAP